MDRIPAQDVTYSVADLPAVLKLGRTRILELIKGKTLRSYREGSRVFVSHQAVLDYIDTKEKASSA